MQSSVVDGSDNLNKYRPLKKVSGFPSCEHHESPGGRNFRSWSFIPLYMPQPLDLAIVVLALRSPSASPSEHAPLPLQFRDSGSVSWESMRIRSQVRCRSLLLLPGPMFRIRRSRRTSVFFLRDGVRFIFLHPNSTRRLCRNVVYNELHLFIVHAYKALYYLPTIGRLYAPTTTQSIEWSSALSALLLSSPFRFVESPCCCTPPK